MKRILSILTLTIFFSQWVIPCSAQYDWKLRKNEDGIKVFRGSVPTSAFKAIKVECTLEGTISSLENVLSKVALQKEWVYHNKSAQILKKQGPGDLYYYSETVMPWPIVNRDAVVHLVITDDTVHDALTAIGTGVPKYIPEKKNKVRVAHSLVHWYVTTPAPGKIHIVYTIEIDPGGSLPAWLVNKFADKGPYESFKNLEQLLEK